MMSTRNRLSAVVQYKTVCSWSLLLLHNTVVGVLRAGVLWAGVLWAGVLWAGVLWAGVLRVGDTRAWYLAPF